MIDLTQEQVEKNLADVLPHGIRTAIAKGTGIHDKIVAAYLNPHDERKSPHYIVLQMQAVIDELDPATGEALWQAMTAMRDQSRRAAGDAVSGLGEGLAKKIANDAGTSAAIAEAVSDGRITLREKAAILVSISRERRDLDAIERSLAEVR